MPVVKVWCLPKTSETKLNDLHRGIVQALKSVPELGIKNEKSITCLFPTDMMQYGLGTEIIVEVTGLFETPERTDSVHQELAEKLGQVVAGAFPDTELVEVFVYPFNVNQGFFTLRRSQYDPHRAYRQLERQSGPRFKDRLDD